MRRAAPVGMTDLGCLAHMVAKIIDDPSFRQGPVRCSERGPRSGESKNVNGDVRLRKQRRLAF